MKHFISAKINKAGAAFTSLEEGTILSPVVFPAVAEENPQLSKYILEEARLGKSAFWASMDEFVPMKDRSVVHLFVLDKADFTPWIMQPLTWKLDVDAPFCWFAQGSSPWSRDISIRAELPYDVSVEDVSEYCLSIAESIAARPYENLADFQAVANGVDEELQVILSREDAAVLMLNASIYRPCGLHFNSRLTSNSATDFIV